MILAAVGVAGGLAIAGSVERTAGGAIVLGAWVLGIASLHRLGRAGSSNREPAAAGEPKRGAEPKAAAEPAKPDADPQDDDAPEGD